MNPDPDDSLIGAAYSRLSVSTEPVEEPVSAVRARMRRRSRRRRTLGAALATSVVAIVALGTVQLVTDPSPRPDASANGAGGGSAARTGALPSGSTQGCAVGYGEEALRVRDWAADATVTDVGRGASTVTVSLSVNTWYRGGSADRLRVRMPGPRSQVEDAPPAYGVGTRLLLSGAGSGTSLVPWQCGFTRYYDEGTAADWARVFAR